jgi:hypothetical protein
MALLLAADVDAAERALWLRCLREAMPGEMPINVIEHLRQIALTPVPEIGYA